VRYKRNVNTDLAAVREAFNRHAPSYDAQFAHSAVGQAMRQTVWDAADRLLADGTRVLDLGCGTGEDALHFARRGMVVTAIDIASEMIGALTAKARAAGLADRIDARTSDMESLAAEETPFDAIFSNFGAINCLSSLNNLRNLAATTIRPGGHVILVSMGRLYPLETATFLLKGDVRGAFRRFGADCSASVEGRKFPVWYYSPRDLRRAFGKEFSLTQVRGLCAVLPAPGLEHLERYFPFGLLRPIDAALTGFRFTASFADHYLSVWQRRA
jgi:2-polyprenyl-3-methyl-5-hydroxy-6-metoxy-1,4-benzoquinol methylase